MHEWLLLGRVNLFLIVNSNPPYYFQLVLAAEYEMLEC